MLINRHLYEKTKNGTEKDHGFCFVGSAGISSVGQKSKGVHLEQASRIIAERMSNRQTNNFIVMPYNPGSVHFSYLVVYCFSYILDC